ncbi:hypothetical protein DFJ77DRAFT_512907 [Powellomyces hirtus]|nr:hypothetical protein DFJ77DRAFT_512907 [Powellomyces hirtus]
MSDARGRGDMRGVNVAVPHIGAGPRNPDYVNTWGTADLLFFGTLIADIGLRSHPGNGDSRKARQPSWNTLRSIRRATPPLPPGLLWILPRLQHCIMPSELGYISPSSVANGYWFTCKTCPDGANLSTWRFAPWDSPASVDWAKTVVDAAVAHLSATLKERQSKAARSVVSGDRQLRREARLSALREAKASFTAVQMGRDVVFTAVWDNELLDLQDYINFTSFEELETIADYRRPYPLPVEVASLVEKPDSKRLMTPASPLRRSRWTGSDLSFPLRFLSSLLQVTATQNFQNGHRWFDSTYTDNSNEIRDISDFIHIRDISDDRVREIEKWIKQLGYFNSVQPVILARNPAGAMTVRAPAGSSTPFVPILSTPPSDVALFVDLH